VRACLLRHRTQTSVQKASARKGSLTTRSPLFAFDRPFRQRGRAGEWTPIHLWEIQQNRLQISLPALRLLARMAPEALGGDFTGDKMPRGRHGWQWLCEAAGLGLLHWKAPGGQALTIGPDNMKAEIVWRLLADGAAVLI
jgi:hypothetical protein